MRAASMPNHVPQRDFVGAPASGTILRVADDTLGARTALPTSPYLRSVALCDETKARGRQLLGGPKRAHIVGTYGLAKNIYPYPQFCCAGASAEAIGKQVPRIQRLGKSVGSTK